MVQQLQAAVPFVMYSEFVLQSEKQELADFFCKSNLPFDANFDLLKILAQESNLACIVVFIVFASIVQASFMELVQLSSVLYVLSELLTERELEFVPPSPHEGLLIFPPKINE